MRKIRRLRPGLNPRTREPEASMLISSLSYPACKTHAPYSHLWSVMLYQIFPHYFIKGKFLKKKKDLLSITSVFSFHVQILPEKFRVLIKNSAR
jgi:hypothetical protein